MVCMRVRVRAHAHTLNHKTSVGPSVGWTLGQVLGLSKLWSLLFSCLQTNGDIIDQPVITAQCGQVAGKSCSPSTLGDRNRCQQPEMPSWVKCPLRETEVDQS